MDAMAYGQRLQRMIACRTISAKNSFDETEFLKLRAVVEELFPLVHQKMERTIVSEDCWIYRLQGIDPSRNIMLMSHHDVVAAEGDWSHDPFGEIAEGKLWGRGTVDTKTPLFAIFSAVEELLEEGFEPPCNLYIGSSHNEEVAGDGMPKARDLFLQQGVRFEVVLDEGGAVIDPPMGGMLCKQCAMIAVHEKGKYYLECEALSGSSHAGLTAASAATQVERMAAFIHEVSEGKLFIRRLNPQVRAMLRHLAPHCKFPLGLVFRNLWLFGGLLTRLMPKLSPQAGGLLGTTCTFNEISGSNSAHRCKATAMFRAVDGQDLKTDLQTFINAAKKYGITVQVREDSEYQEPADMTQPAFAYTMACIGKVFPHDPAVPMILPAGTDARTLTELCPCVLRFAPIRLSKQQLASVHSENENIDLDAICDAVTFYKTFLKSYP